MKALLITFLTTTLVASTSFAQESVIISNEIAKAIEEANLHDGRVINFKKEVERLYLNNKKIDYFELRNGEIVDRTDIRSIKLPDSHRHILKATGVDGGG